MTQREDGQLPAKQPRNWEWVRIGDILKERRAAIAPAFGVREQFIRERGQGMANRSFYALEAGERGNFDPGTISGFERAYDLPDGWLAAALAGDIGPLPVPGAVGLTADRVLADFMFLMKAPASVLDDLAKTVVGSAADPEDRVKMWELLQLVRSLRGNGQDGAQEQDAG